MPPLELVLDRIMEGTERTAEEERAAIEGRTLDDSGHSCKKRADQLRSQLRSDGSGVRSMTAELATLGPAMVQSWVPAEAARFARLLSQVHSGSREGRRTCAALSETLDTCAQKVLAWRAVAGTEWSQAWSAACRRFCPGMTLKDALSTVTSSVEQACAEVLRERVADLQLELVPAEVDPEAEEKAQIREMRKQSRLRVLRFDEQLAEVLEDFDHICKNEVPIEAMLALLAAIRERLATACAAVPISESLQRATQNALALGALMDAIVGDREEAGASVASPTASRLSGLLYKASTLGQRTLAAAQCITDDMRSRSDEAYAAWAAAVVRADASDALLSSFWRLAKDEVQFACGWGNARFQAAKSQAEGVDSVAVPIQVSSFVSERLTCCARRVVEMNGSTAVPCALIAALKSALAASFVAAYKQHEHKSAGMCHLLQWLFDLRFLRVSLNTTSALGAQSPAYLSLCELLDEAEAATLADPVDAMLYQEVLKSCVTLHIEAVRLVLAPFFSHNALYNYLGSALPAEKPPYEIQATFSAPLRTMLPRFPLLPVATSMSMGPDLDMRLDLGAQYQTRPDANASGNAAGGLDSLMKAGGGLVAQGNAALGKLGGVWSSWGAATKPEAV